MMLPKLRETKEWHDLEAAVAALSRKESELMLQEDNDYIQNMMLVEFAVVGYEVPFQHDTVKGRYFEFHSTEMPHTIPGLLEEGAELVAQYYGGHCDCGDDD